MKRRIKLISRVRLALTSSRLPKHIWILIFLYFMASLAHFVHNAEYIAIYPNMPIWITRKTVYLAWLAITSVGILALVFLCLGFRRIGIALIAVYAGFGLDGLAHYTLALCAEHTFITNVTIWSEAILGLLLLLVSARFFALRVARPVMIGQ